MEDKKNMLANTDASQQTQRQDTTPAVFSQQLANLPEEILSQPRFFAVKKNKEPKAKGWSNPKNQKLYSEIQGLAGFDTAGHNVAADYLFLDFDHVLNDQGEFVTAVAEECFNRTQNYLKTYCEISASGHGIHIIAKPTVGKFKKVSSGENGRIYFDTEKKSFLEIFYRTGGRYCLFTGNVFRCEPKTPIAHGEPVDGVFQNLLDVIAKRAKKSLKTAQEAKETQPISDSADYDLFRAKIMLDAINPADLADSDWLAVISSCKNIGIAYSVVDTWNQRDPERYNEEENKMRWDSATDPHFDIETLHGIAKRFGYVERDTRREWYNLHPDLKPQKNSDTSNALMSDDGAEENFIGTRDKIKSCPVNLKIPDNYLFQKSGITLVVPPKSEKGETKYICAALTPIVPTRKFREPVKGTLEYEFAILDGEKWRKVEIDGAALADTRDLSKTLSKYGAQITKAEILREFLVKILALNPDLQEIKVYNKTGWHDDKFIYPTGGKDYIVRRAGFDFDKTFKPKGNPEEWKKKFVEISEHGGAVVCAYFGVALAAPFAEPIIGANPSAHLFGKSGSGKTALQKFIASTYGNPRELIRTFAATNKNRLLVAAAYNGLPTFFDELETIQGKKAEEALSTDVYNFYDGTGNQANKRDGTAREIFKFRASRLTTGERQTLKQHDLRGAFKRQLPFNAGSNLLPDETAAELHFFAEANYGHFGKVWIDFVSEHLEEIQKQYIFFAKFYTPLKTYEPTQLKMLAAAVVAFEFFSVAIGVKSDFDKYTCIRIMRAIVDTLSTTTELDDTTRAIEALGSYVASHEKIFVRDEKDSETGNSNEIGAWGTTCCGKIFDTGEVAFHPTELKRILEDELHFASADKLIAEWKEQGNILFVDKGRTTHLIRIGSKVYRTVHFKANVVSTDIDSAEEKYYEELENS